MADRDGPRRRRLSCQGPEYLFDLDERRVVSLDELVDHVRRGGRFSAVDEESGQDRTLLVLARMLEGTMPSVPAPAGASLLSGLAALGPAGHVAGLLGDGDRRSGRPSAGRRHERRRPPAEGGGT